MNVSVVLKSSTPGLHVKLFFFLSLVCFVFITQTNKIHFGLKLVCVRLLLLMTESDPSNKKEDDSENLGRSWQSKMEGWTIFQRKK